MSDTTTTDVSTIEEGVIEEDFNPSTGEVLEATVIDPGAIVVQDAIQRLQSGTVSVYSTVIGDDFDAKLQVLGAVTNALPIADHIGEHIDLKNVVVQSVQLTKRDRNGNAEIDSHDNPIKFTAPRVILIDANGTAYYGISGVLLDALQTFMGVLGQPAGWPEPVGMKVTREKARIGSFYTMILDPIKKTVSAKK